MQTFWHAIATFVLQNLPLVIGWLVFIGASALLNPFISQRIRRANEKRDEHLAELKRDVLQPMLGYLTDHVLPVVEHRRANVGICRELSRKQVPKATENPTVITVRLCTYDVTEPPPDSYVDARGMPVPDRLFEGPLCDDAKEHHFRALFSMWERVIAAFVSYNATCLRYAEELRSAILGSSPLPEFTGNLIPRYVDAKAAALFVLHSQLGLTYASLSRIGGTPDSLQFQNTGIATGSPEEITKCVEKIDTLIAQRDAVERLLADAVELRAQVNVLKTELERALLVRKLCGRCRYIA